jgi:3-(methylthio)propionyl---CoA ligase
MMDRPLLISSIIEHASAQHGKTEIVSRETHGPVFRYSFADCAARAKQLANALADLRLDPGSAVATIATSRSTMRYRAAAWSFIPAIRACISIN